eukprot:CAMPEP_0113566624 /NCGR_PEP_ID=MMETSP0015_2-20120614/22825_1 /TAXON_ID=2838 /ORGANISM="Odontella" /LENGTH=151 /DNA_ID=CAMNT_0000468931 /DNA_START=60 /DNA_END=515 /DNA_ORIENTATION=+ /assembly_acc=CAM_ASM_000160
MRKFYLVFAVALIGSCALAQQGNYGGYGNENNNYQGYAGQDDNMYANYAARQREKAVGGGFGWPKLIVVGVAGYIAGAKIHTARLKHSMPKLRFKVKQRVKCNMGTKWAKGTIVKLWGQQAEGQWLPYQIKLDNGEMIFAPADTDVTIRAA